MGSFITTGASRTSGLMLVAKYVDGRRMEMFVDEKTQVEAAIAGLPEPIRERVKAWEWCFVETLG